MIKGVIFDLKSTIFDYEDLMRDVTNETLSQFKVHLSQREWDEEFRGLLLQDIAGKIVSMKDISITIKGLSEQIQRKRQSFLSKYDLDSTKGLAELLTYLRGKKIKVLFYSDFPQKITEQILKSLNLSKYKFVSVEDVAVKKPASDCYELCVQELSLIQDEVLIFEGTYEGGLATKGTSCKLVLVTEKPLSEFPHLKPKQLIKDFREIDYTQLS